MCVIWLLILPYHLFDMSLIAWAYMTIDLRFQWWKPWGVPTSTAVSHPITTIPTRSLFLHFCTFHSFDLLFCCSLLSLFVRFRPHNLGFRIYGHMTTSPNFLRWFWFFRDNLLMMLSECWMAMIEIGKPKKLKVETLAPRDPTPWKSSNHIPGCDSQTYGDC